MGYVNQYGLSRKVRRFPRLFVIRTHDGTLSFQHIFESIKHSLERLQLDYVDVLQCTPSVTDLSLTQF
jgi:aryl-alcohol dehydrogenase-like predicted oxidoreductase